MSEADRDKQRWRVSVSWIETDRECQRQKAMDRDGQRVSEADRDVDEWMSEAERQKDRQTNRDIGGWMSVADRDRGR